MNVPIGKGTGFVLSITGCRSKSGLQNTRHVDLQETPQVKKKKKADGMRANSFTQYIQNDCLPPGT